MKFINLTPHDVVLNNGIVIPKSGDIARVAVDYGEFDRNCIATAMFKPERPLPPEQPRTVYIVSGLASVVLNRYDVVSPAVLHPQCKRGADGSITSVPGFFRAAL